MGHTVYIGLYREKHEKIFLSETTSPRALIFGMKHHLVNLYQVCSNYAPVSGDTCLYREKHEKIFSSEIVWPRALILSM